MTKIPKYRDQVVLLTRMLSELDGKSIKHNERAYLNTLAQRKQSVNMQQKKVEPGVKLGVAGHTKKVYGHTHA